MKHSHNQKRHRLDASCGFYRLDASWSIVNVHEDETSRQLAADLLSSSLLATCSKLIVIIKPISSVIFRYYEITSKIVSKSYVFQVVRSPQTTIRTKIFIMILPEKVFKYGQGDRKK